LVGFCQLASTFEIVSVGVLPTKRGHASSVFDGIDSVFLLAGWKENIHSGYLDDVLHYNVTSGTAESVANFPMAFTDGAAGTDGNGAFFHFGGTPKYGTAMRDIFQFTAANLTPIPIGRLPDGFYYHSTASDGHGSIYIIGGNGQNPTAIYHYNTTNSEIEVVGHIKHQLLSPTTAWVGGSVYIFGGYRAYPYTELPTEIYRFMPSTGQVVELQEKLIGGSHYGGSVVVGEDIYLVGGTNEFNGFRFSKFSTLTETVEDLEVTNYSFELQTCSALTYVPQTNRIYVFGGSSQSSEEFDEIFYIQL